MAQKRHYEVKNRFPVRVAVKDEHGKETDETEVVWITAARAHEIDDLLSAAQIKEHITAQDLKDNGAVTPETAASERPRKPAGSK